jgi:hypothetical protein
LKIKRAAKKEKVGKMNLYQYLNTISRLWNNYDGVGISKFVSLNGNHVNNPNLHTDSSESQIERHLESPLDEIVNAHLRVLFYTNESRKFLTICKQLIKF